MTTPNKSPFSTVESDLKYTNVCNNSTVKPAPIFKSYDPDFDTKLCEYFQKMSLEEKTLCTRCVGEGRLLNKDPMKSNHNCWKYI